MKKLLSIILALMLCLSVAVVFSACDSSSDDVDVNAPSNSEKPTEKPTEPPSPTNTEVAVKSFNKIDLAKFLSVTDNSIEELKKASAKAEVNISLPDESGSLTAAIKDGVFYLAVTEEGYGTDEAFGKISEDKISIFSLVDGAWEQVEEIDLNASAPSASGALTNPEDIISKIKIPELKKEYLTEKNNMLLVSNDYIYELITNNITAIAGEDIPEEDLEEMKASVKDSLKEAGLEVFVATGAEEITKLAISIDPAEDESDRKMEKEGKGTVPASLCFPQSTVGKAEYPWAYLLENGVLPHEDARDMTPTYMISNKWLPLLADSVAKEETWYSLLQYGIAIYEGADHTVTADQSCTDEDCLYRMNTAEKAWLKSVSLKPSVWGYRNLAVLEAQRGDFATCAELPAQNAQIVLNRM